MRFMKAQLSLEYLLLVGLILMLLAPVFYYAFSTSTQTIKMNEADNFVKSIANTADTLYSLGPGSQDSIEINVPKGTKNITLKNKEVLLIIYIFNGEAYISADTKTNISGNITTKSGSYHITLKNENNTIKVTSGY